MNGDTRNGKAVDGLTEGDVVDGKAVDGYTLRVNTKHQTDYIIK